MSDAYYAVRAVSNSSLKWFEVSPRFFQAKYNDELSDGALPHLELGKKVHMAILEPDRFEEEFSCVDFDIPTSKQQKEFCQLYTKELKTAENSDIAASKAYSKVYQIKGKSEDRIATDAVKLLKKLDSYIKYLTVSEKVDKKLVNRKNKDIIINGVQNIKNHKLANKLVIDDEVNLLSHNIDTFNELEIMFDYPRQFHDYTMRCKSMIDRLVIDHDNKVVKLVDLKTTFTIKEVNDFISKFRYYRQLAYYWIAINKFFQEQYPDKNIEEYTAESYIVFVSTNEPYECKVVKLDDGVILSAMGEINTLISELSWHFKNECWDYPRSYYESEGYSTYGVTDLKDLYNEED